ncbi:MAG: M20/M25/M40 family metallo-hydrolase [Pedosphaera sp.]|nr:M20/M25/M40 family metallo-hydrolase [Pedosphaera sp.]
MTFTEIFRRPIEQQLSTALDFLRQMVEINSWTRNSSGVNQLARFTAQVFAPLGFTAEFVQSADPGQGQHLFLIRNGSGDGQTVGLISHLDTVFPPEEEYRNNFKWQVEGQHIYGPGTEDIKGGTALLWLMLSNLKEGVPHLFDQTRWVICLNAAEEELSSEFGPLSLIRLGSKARAALVFEAEGRREGVSRLVRARKGRGTFRIEALGRSAHAGVDHHRGANAIAQLAHSVLQAEAFTDPSKQLTVNVRRIEGGGGLNRVPHQAIADGEFRVFDSAYYAKARASLLNLSGPGQILSAADGFHCQLNVQIIGETAPWPPNAATDDLLNHWIATGSELGLKIEGEERGGLSDGNHLWAALPTLDGLVPAGGNSHCSERTVDGSKLPEFVDASSFAPKALLNSMALLRLLQPC